MSDDVASAHPYPPRQPLAAQPNGASKPPRSDPWDSQARYYDDEYGHLASNPVQELSRTGSGEIGASGSDPDSALEYYKSPDGKIEAVAKGKGAKKGAKKAGWTALEKDQNNWIHRDKLKEIEIREMEEAGFKVGRSSRSNSRTQGARRASRDRTNSEATEPTTNGDDRVSNRRIISPIPMETEDEEASAGRPSWGDLRTPEEIAAEREQYAARNNNVIRPSTSRIPIAKTSPLPVPHTFVERDQPLPRSRNGSGNWDTDALAMNGARVRSGSVSSHVLLDDPGAWDEPQQSPRKGNFSMPKSPTSGSSPKAKTPGKLAPTSGGRKASAQKAGAKPRVPSATSPVKRPGTSGGSLSRPGTSHRPEGEAPWIATMYKPDPRLPPEEQIIPTHAKRMQQEQWETEGRVASMYDKDFNMLNTDDFKDKRASPVQPIDIRQAQEDQTWPLPSPTKPSTERIDTSIKSPTLEQGGYKLTPTIPQSPRVPSRNSERHLAPSISSKPPQTIRVPEPPVGTEKEPEKKGCCCIVM
jgi:hypothetical protein